ncbi:MAG: hypothetical protein PHC44_02225 [Lutispora sp.]|nr:hypothetical protein [Lutispora sp.]MDD4833531.1 hypothetical protein [Lutispora sp.]
MINYINYLLTIIGIGMIIISLFLIASDKIRGEGIYFDLYVKEQEIKKAIDDANEMIGEMVYTSEAVINQIEEHISSRRESLINISSETNKPIVSMEEDKFISNDLQASKKNKKEIDILKLFNGGMNVDNIAKKLDIGKGEVSLILSLNSGVIKDENI